MPRCTYHLSNFSIRNAGPFTHSPPIDGNGQSIPNRTTSAASSRWRMRSTCSPPLFPQTYAGLKRRAISARHTGFHALRPRSPNTPVAAQGRPSARPARSPCTRPPTWTPGHAHASASLCNPPALSQSARDDHAPLKPHSRAALVIRGAAAIKHTTSHGSRMRSQPHCITLSDRFAPDEWSPSRSPLIRMHAPSCNWEGCVCTFSQHPM
jgi:hypothetical protein